MRLSVKHIPIQTNHIRLTKDKIEILQRLRRPKRFHAIGFWGWHGSHVLESCAAEFGFCVAFDGLEHFPCIFAEAFIASYAVEYEDGLDCFGPCIR